MISQLFLGVRLDCAKCHHHPFEKWSQDDFYSFAAYFAKLGHKGTGLSPPISGGEEIIHLAKRGEVKHPLTQQVLAPRPLFGSAPEIADDRDPREALAAWMTSEENHYFGQVITNRVWADLMGRGLVEPVDDLRATNPATNEPLPRVRNSPNHGSYDSNTWCRMPVPLVSVRNSVRKPISARAGTSHSIRIQPVPWLTNCSIRPLRLASNWVIAPR